MDSSLTYLNSGTHSICPREVTAAVTRYQREFERNPTAELFAAWGKLWETQVDLAQFLKADPQDLFLRPNITLVMNAFILGVELPKGSEILLSDVEYGAIANLCRLKAEQGGLKLRRFHLPNDCADPVALVKQELKPETSLLVLSHIITGNGQVLPVEQIARVTRERGVLFAVDGAHSPGALALDFTRLEDVDCYGGNLHKWVMAPKGTSFGWIPKRNRARVKSTYGGWTTFEIPGPFAAFGGGDLFQARMLMSACYDFAPFFGIRDTLAFWRRHGGDQIRARLYALQAHLERRLDEKLGWRKLSPPAGARRGPLLAYELPAELATQGFHLMQKIYQEHRLQIMIAPFRDSACLRVSPHVYNTEAELDRAAEILGRLKR